MNEIKEFKLILVDPKESLCNAWREKFGDYERVEIINGYFEDIDVFDCMVSAANSYGLMDGGVDLAITRYFGMDLPHKVQERIKVEYYGEQPVGTSMIVETGNKKHPYVAHTPTMRVPLKITNTDNVYSAKFAMLRAIANHNKINKQKIKTVICSGLGTSAGRMPVKEAARQMELAYKNFYNPPRFYSWFHILDRQKEIKYGGDVWNEEESK